MSNPSKKRVEVSKFVKDLSDLSPFSNDEPKNPKSQAEHFTNQAQKFLNFNFGVILVISIFGGPIFTGFAGIDRAWQALAVSIVLFVLCFTKWMFKRKLCQQKHSLPSPKILGVIFLFECLFLSLTFPSFYFAIAGVVDKNNLPLHDKLIVKIDMLLMGNSFFPKGQISLWVDQHPVLNPNTALGKLILDILQAVYVSYYFWGYILMIWLMWKAISGWWFKNEEQTNDSTTKLKILLCAWFASYLLTWLGNLLFPGVSPRIYLKDFYTHSQDGFGLSYQVTKSIQQFRTFATFPSGHVGETFVVALTALRISPLYGKITT